MSNLRDANLRSTDLRCVLAHATLFDFADATGANFDGAKLASISVNSVTNFTRASFRGAILCGLNLNCNFTDADFTGATLIDVDFNMAQTDGVCVSTM